jgi:hypothetical protein
LPEKFFCSRSFEVDHVSDDVIEIDEAGGDLIVGSGIDERFQVDVQRVLRVVLVVNRRSHTFVQFLRNDLEQTLDYID